MGGARWCGTEGNGVENAAPDAGKLRNVVLWKRRRWTAFSSRL